MTDPAGAVLEAAGRAHHRAGDYRAALEAYESAYRAHRRDGDVLAGARAARTVAWFRGWVFGEWAVARGWQERARSLVTQADPGGSSTEQGHLLLDEARRGDDLEEQRRQYLAAADVARRGGDPDLECEATASLGMMLIFSGHVADGMARLDEALALICAGEVEELPVLEGCLCGLLHACEHTHDVGRAQEWLDATRAVVQGQALVTAAGYCRSHYASILISAGRWAEAEVELDTALSVLPDTVVIRDEVLCRLADLRIRQGRFEEAMQLLSGLEHHEAAMQPLVTVHLAQGRSELAVEIVERALLAEDLEPHVEAPLLGLSVEANLARGALDDATAASARLTELSRGHSSPYVRAIGAVARAQTCVATGAGDARSCWHQALSLFADAGRPVDLARCRLELARTIAADRPDAAKVEVATALEVFDQVGATREADDAAALLRSLGGARTGPKRRSTLTRREDEVLDLLGHGLTNVEIADRLFISPKTVEHHVSRVLYKLGLRSRTEAAAFAVRTTGSGRG